jgi:hypothetical protein
MECLPGISSTYFLRLLVTVPVAPMTTGMTEHFMLHIRWISMHKFVYFNFFSASLCVTFLSDGTDTSISVQIFSLLFLIIICGQFAKTALPVCTPWFHNTVISSRSRTGLGTYEYQLSGISIPNSLHTE